MCAASNIQYSAMASAESDNSSCLIIGIGGVTCGGKTSLCKQLQGHYPDAHVISMDDYCWPEGSEHNIFLPEFNYENWDCVSSVNFAKMLEAVNTWKEQIVASGTPRFLFVEGILVYNNIAFASLFQKKYFFTLDKATCWERRRLRVYEPPDPPDRQGYFDKIAWPFYVQNKSDISDQTDIVYLDGSRDQTESFQRVLGDLETLIGSRSNNNLPLS